MYRDPPVRTPHSSTADLLTWPEKPPAERPEAPASRRSLKPADRISPAMFGASVTEEEEAEILNERKPCSDLKLQEMNGSGIFTADEQNGASETEGAIPQQAVGGISQISFGTEGIEPPRKPTSIAEIAKQRELSGTAESELEAKVRKQLSEAKCRELGGNDIFGPPPEAPPRHSTARNLELRSNIGFGSPQPRGHVSLMQVAFDEEKVSSTAKKIYSRKIQELAGNDIFRGDALHWSAEKQLSTAKLKEMSGSNIFANGNGKTVTRYYLGGVRKPPGGGSSFAFA
ncbi:hypothetical protein C4D60_Mb05t12390 [Musa balbisiana]|uniref:DUF4057 domain-containing protein n=1 Tax=Musa balbisiana TaxID=52838 RepID=A0A4S8JVM2_MUSBA|nr:hypothetical protein C4D60_Mb05t12390 [Musa balbisiana]